MTICAEHTQSLFARTVSGYSGKSLAIDVTDENILRDVKELIALRVSSR